MTCSKGGILQVLRCDFVDAQERLGHFKMVIEWPAKFTSGVTNFRSET